MYVRVKFAKDLTSTKDIDFSMMIYLTVDGKRQQSSELELSGTLVREVFEAYDNESYFDISDGGVVEADRYIKNVELYLGSGERQSPTSPAGGNTPEPPPQSLLQPMMPCFQNIGILSKSLP